LSDEQMWAEEHVQNMTMWKEDITWRKEELTNQKDDFLAQQTEQENMRKESIRLDREMKSTMLHEQLN